MDNSAYRNSRYILAYDRGSQGRFYRAENWMIWDKEKGEMVYLNNQVLVFYEQAQAQSVVDKFNNLTVDSEK